MDVQFVITYHVKMQVGHSSFLFIRGVSQKLTGVATKPKNEEWWKEERALTCRSAPVNPAHKPAMTGKAILNVPSRKNSFVFPEMSN